MMKRILRLQSGFTLIELMVAVALVAILIALSAPSFRQMIEMQRLRGAHDQFATDMQFARSEATRLRVPVHVRVQPAAAPAAACYILFTDTNRVAPYSNACDCTQPAGLRCGQATTTEVKTVTLDTWTGLDLATINQARIGFDPATGAMMVAGADVPGLVVTEFIVDTSLDTTRKLRTVVGFSGRVRSCAPAGSVVKTIAC